MDFNKDADELTEDKISKINSAGLNNVRISRLWEDYNNDYRNGKFLRTNSDLDCLWIEFGSENGIKDSDTENEYKKIEKELMETGELTNSIEVKGFGQVTSEHKERFNKQKLILQKKAMFIRRLQNEQGKGTAYLDSADGDFD